MTLSEAIGDSGLTCRAFFDIDADSWPRGTSPGLGGPGLPPRRKTRGSPGFAFGRPSASAPTLSSDKQHPIRKITIDLLNDVPPVESIGTFGQIDAPVIPKPNVSRGDANAVVSGRAENAKIGDSPGL